MRRLAPLLLVLFGACATTKPRAPAPPVEVAKGDVVEAEATVEIRIGMAPPARVGAWTCEPRSWDEHGFARLRCTAPPGTAGFVEALRAAPEIAAVAGER
jgi:hypothetical protein